MNVPADTLMIGAAGAVLLAALWPRLRRVHRTRHWRSAAATILEAWLDDGGGNPRDRRVKLCARYRFSADGTTYVGERIAFTSPIYRDYVNAERRLKQLTPGKRIEVWYDPARPADAVIERTISRTHYLLAAVAVFCMAEVVVWLMVGLIAG
ncbi:MAG: DUF3592 domain-containing protein [Vicinamibacterales bacterium]